MEEENEELGFGVGYGFPPSHVCLAPFSTPRRLSSHFSEPNRPIQSSRRLSWVSLQGCIVNADEASSSKTIGGGLKGEEAVAWDLFSPIHRILIVAIVGVAVVEMNKNRQIWKLRRSVDLRDKVLLSMQQKLDDLCEQLSNMKDGPESVANVSLKEFQLTNDAKCGEPKISSCGCNSCDHHWNQSNGLMDSFNKIPRGDEMFKFKMPIMIGAEQEERRMSDLSDWNSSVTSAADIQMSSLALEQDIYNLTRECGEKDATIKELSALVHAADVANSKRVAELEDVIRRKNMVITKLKKDMMVLEQQVVHLTRLRRPSSTCCSSSSSTESLHKRPFMADNLLYDMDSTTSSSSSDSDCDLRNIPQNSVTQEDSNFSCNENESAPKRNPKLDSLIAPKLQPLKENNMNQRPSIAVTSRPKQLVSMRGDQKGNKRHGQRGGSKETNTSKKWV